MLVSRLNSDIQVIQDAMSTNISMAVRSVVFIIVVLVVLFLLSWQLTAVTFAAIIPICIFAVLYGRRMRTISKQVQEEKAKMNTSAEESFSNVRTVKAFSNELNEAEKFSKGNIASYDWGIKKA